MKSIMVVRSAGLKELGCSRRAGGSSLLSKGREDRSEALVTKD